MAKTADLDEARVSLLVELLSAAGLIASGTPDPAPVSDNADEYWTPTLAVDGWLNASTARRWEVLASAWVDGTASSVDDRAEGFHRQAHRGVVRGRPGPGGSARSPGHSGAALRTRQWPDCIGRRGKSTTGVATPAMERAPTDVRDRAGLWTRPPRSGWWPAARCRHLDELCCTAGTPKPKCSPPYPSPSTTSWSQADLTLVAPGPLVPDLLEQVSLVADIESAGSASMYRISEDSVRRALDAGLTATELHAMFASKSKTPVPNHFRI